MAERTDTVTRYRRALLAQITSGTITALPKIKYIAVGTGGLNEDGTPKVPDATQTALEHELKRFDVGAPTFPVNTTAQYTVDIQETDADIDGQYLSEFALVDASGQICAIRNTMKKGKAAGEQLTIKMDDVF
jgi:phage-related tail fiber protein